MPEMIDATTLPKPANLTAWCRDLRALYPWERAYLCGWIIEGDEVGQNLPNYNDGKSDRRNNAT